MTFGTEWGWGSDKDTSRAILDKYVDGGGNFIDTSNYYTDGTSESFLGEFLKDRREWFVLGTKYSLSTRKGDPNAGGNHRKNMVQAVEGSLKRLRTDYIDVYWLHAWDFSTPVDELMRGLDDLVRQGKICYIAISDMPAWKAAQLNQYAECHALTRFTAYQAEYNLVTRDVERDVLPMCRELGLGLTPWAPLAGGVLAGKYSHEDMEREGRERGADDLFGSNENRMPMLTEKKLEIADTVKEVAEQAGRSPSQVALNWLLNQPGVASLIIGARKLSHLEDNLACLDFALDDEQLDRLNEISQIEMGFPHDFINNPVVRKIITGDTDVALPVP
jgi:aryl-alcohol dehydrogenase-like predicted oxidoreductase